MLIIHLPLSPGDSFVMETTWLWPNPEVAKSISNAEIKVQGYLSWLKKLLFSNRKITSKSMNIEFVLDIIPKQIRAHRL